MVIQNQSSASKSYRFSNLVVAGHAVDQFMKRSPLQLSGEGREHHSAVATRIAQAVRQGIYVADKQSGGKLFLHGGMGYVVLVFPHYRKVITCYRVSH
jgi:hypothetical protein